MNITLQVVNEECTLSASESHNGQELQFVQRFLIGDLLDARNAFLFYMLMGVAFSDELSQAIHDRYQVLFDGIRGTK